MKPEKQKREVQRNDWTSMHLLPSRLGISKLKIELDNLALSYLEPEAY